MTRTNVALIVVAAVLATALGTFLWFQQSAGGLSEAEVRAIVDEKLADVTTTQTLTEAPALDAASLEPMIESYLMANPKILERMSVALSDQRAAEEATQNAAAIASIHDDIFNDADHAVVGNPDGDITLVEMFDYNCSYCRSALPDMAQLIENDPNLKIVLMEFPILSQGSVDAARVAVAATRAGVDYWAFHTQLFGGRGQVTGDAALDAAAALGLDRAALEADAKSDAVSAVISKSYDVAQILSIGGTPAYIIGDEVVSGAVGMDALKKRIDNLRTCGKTLCDG